RPGATRRAGVFCGHGFVAKLARWHRCVLRPAPARGTKFLRRSQFNLTGLCSRLTHGRTMKAASIAEDALYGVLMKKGY
ncbi:MAG: hypothetical protein V3U18_06830, partial [Alphaproteobacteria bacterium]